VRTDLLRVALSVGLLSATVGVACSNSSSGGGTTTTTPDAGNTTDTGSGSADTGTVAVTEASADGGCLSVPLVPTDTGYVAVTDINLVGSWFSYGDGQGSTGSPPGDCQTKGGFPSSACSSITFPPPPEAGAIASFPPYMGGTLGTMCLVGTAAQVTGTPPDYSDIFGIGIGLDFNNPGGDSGGPQPYNATAANITALTFTVAGLPTALGTRVNIEFQEPATDVAPNDAWAYQIMSNGPTTVLLQSGLGNGQLQPAFSATYPAGQSQPAFDPTMLEGIQFHVVTNTKNAIPVAGLCISDLAVTVCPQ
jgi:hypothetical protein